MHYRTLGRTGLEVSLLSYGSGGPSNLGQTTDMSQLEQDALIRRCLDLGINLFDTAEGYGHSEEILGRALTDVPRDSYYLATKWAYQRDDELKEDPKALSASVDRSLARLGTNHIDIMQLHGVLPQHYHQVVQRYYPELRRLREEGKIRFIGLSERFVLDPMHEAAALALNTDPGLWDTVMLKYGILNQYAAKEVLPLAQQHGVGVINMAAVRIKLPRPQLLEALISEWKQRGVIPGDSLPDSDPLGWLIHDDVDSVVSAGYKFAADHPAISTVLTGTASTHHLEANVAALEVPSLPEPDNERLAALFSEVAEYA